MEKGYLKISGSLYWRQPCPTLGKYAFQQGNRAKQRVESGWLPRQAGLIYPSAGETDFLVWLIIEMCLTGNFIGLRAKNAELVTADTMLG